MNEGARASAAAMCSAPITRTTRDQPHTNRTSDKPTGTRILYKQQTAARQASAGAGLLLVNGVAKAAAATTARFLFHDRHCRAYVTIGRCKAQHCPPAPPRASISAAATNRWRACAAISREFGDIYRVFAPGRGVYNYVINHPDDIKRVLLSNHRNYTKGEGMDRVKILLGNGIMTSEGDFWRRQRRMMQPSFHRRVIDQFSALIREVNDKFAARWADKAARARSRSI